MIRIRKKLNNNAGASMIFALALMLVCIVVSSIIISAAASGVSRNNKRTTQQQEYLAVSSAAELIVQELKDAGSFKGNKVSQIPGCEEQLSKPAETFVVNKDAEQITYTGYRLAEPLNPAAEMSFLIKEKKVDGAAEYTHRNCPTGSDAAQEGTFGGNLQLVLSEACMHVMKEGTAYQADPSNSDKGVFSISVNNGETRIPEIRCQLSMDENYNITVQIFSATASEDAVVTVEMKSNGVTEQAAGTGELSNKCQNVHKVLNIFANGDVVEVDHQFDKIGASSTLNVSWSEPVILKGGQN